MKAKVLYTERTVYPLDYDKNNPNGFEKWRQDIHSQLLDQIGPGNMFIFQVTKALTKFRQPVPIPSTKHQNVIGDRVIYAIIFIMAISAAIFISQ